MNKNDAIHAIAGSAAFWLPNIVLHVLKGPDASFSHWGLLASLQAFTTVATLLATFFFWSEGISLRRIASWMLLGIWVLGPVWLSINSTFTGGGFASEGGWLSVLLAILLFPMTTLILSVYDGSILSLLIITLLLGLACVEVTAIPSRFRRRSS